MRMSAHLSFPNLTVQNMSQTLSSAIERPIGPAEDTGMKGLSIIKIFECTTK